MRVFLHPEFPEDVRKFASEYDEISRNLADRFRQEIAGAIVAIETSPGSAGHFLNLGSSIVTSLRRKNLHAFPFFVLYGVIGDRLILGAVIPSRSDPLKWVTRFRRFAR